MIEVHALTKCFPNPDGSQKVAVNEVSFVVRPGEVYGLLGPNGAGKTTTLRMISGLLAATSGRVLISGIDVTDDPEAVKRGIGYLTPNTGLYARLTPLEQLRYFATLYGLDRLRGQSRIDQLVEWLDMSTFMTLRCGALSTGQKQRVSIARALIGDPKVLVLDEPTLGLDVLSNRLILNFVRTQAEVGKTVVLSTHALDEIESMCRRVGLIHAGKLIADGDLESLRAQTGKQRLSEVFLSLVGADEPLLAD